MSTEQDVARSLRSWLKEERHEDADRVLDAVFDRVPATPQRRAGWLAWRFLELNSLNKLAVAGAAVLVIVVVAINLLSTPGGVGGPSESASPGESAQPDPSATAVDVLPQGELLKTRYSLKVGDVSLSFSVPADGWTPGPIEKLTGDGGFHSRGLYISKSRVGPQNAEAVLFWTTFPPTVDAASCANLLGPSAADLATQVASAPGTELRTGPSDITLGGLPAKYVVVTVKEAVGCQPGFFYTWEDEKWGPFWAGTAAGDTIHVWVVDVGGTILFIEGETQLGLGSALGQEIQQIVKSISFP